MCSCTVSAKLIDTELNEKGWIYSHVNFQLNLSSVVENFSLSQLIMFFLSYKQNIVNLH